MKQYKVVVNGVAYEVAVELLGEGEVVAASAAAPAPAAPAPAPVTAPAGGEPVKAPMPGTILSVKVAEGAAVTKGQVLFILEAMKMENEICAPCDGTVTGLTIKDGVSVQSGQQVCVIA